MEGSLDFNCSWIYLNATDTYAAIYSSDFGEAILSPICTVGVFDDEVSFSVLDTIPDGCDFMVEISSTGSVVDYSTLIT